MMTKESLYSIFAIILLFFTSCSVDDNLKPEDDQNNSFVPNETVVRAFDIMFPDAKSVKWDTYSSYSVANFAEYGYAKNAWFDQKGGWHLTKTAIATHKVPTAVSTSFSLGTFAGSSVKTSNLLERKDFEDVYVYEVSNNGANVNIYYSEGGDFIKSAKNNGGYVETPVSLTKNVSAFVSNNYPQAQILDSWTDAIGEKVCILNKDGYYMVIAFDISGNWMSTIINVTQEYVPEVVMEGFRNSRYGSYPVDDIKYADREEENLYYFYFSAEEKNKIATIQETGSLVAVLSY